MSTEKLPGITRTEAGRLTVRVAMVDPRTGKRVDRIRLMEESASLADAVRAREELVKGITAEGPRKAKEQTVGEFAPSWLEGRRPWLQSKNTLRRYADALDLQILPVLGDLRVSSVTGDDLRKWFAHWTRANKYALHDAALIRAAKQKAEKVAALNLPPGTPQGDRHDRGALLRHNGRRVWEVPVPKLRKAKPYSPYTINQWWGVLEQMIKAAVLEFDLPRDPTLGIKPLATPKKLKSQRNTFTDDELVKLFDYCKLHHPQWYAFMVLGFGIGARPGELRPLRWNEDLNPETGHLILQQSQRDDHLGETKTKEDRETLLPQGLLDLLLWHRQFLFQIGHPGAGSGLVFPGWGQWRPWHRVGSRRAKHSQRAAKNEFMSKSAFDKPLAEMAMAIGISIRISPKAMRRRFNDATAEHQVDPLVTRALTGHKSDDMRNTYSTITQERKREAVAKVISLFDLTPPKLAPEAPNSHSRSHFGGRLGAISDAPRRDKTEVKS